MVARAAWTGGVVPARRESTSRKTLEDAGVKLAALANDILGASGRAMLEALVQGTTGPAVLANLARGTLRTTLPALREALAGRFRTHHAFLVGQRLAHLDYLDEAINQYAERAPGRTAGPCRGDRGAPGRHPRNQPADG
jgi:hypothetical protein